MAGTLTPALTLSNLTLADAGSYRAIITNLFGSVTSHVGALTVVAPDVVFWTGAAGDSRWDTAANWSGGAVPNATNDVLIDGTTNQTVYYFGSQPKVRSLENHVTLWIQGNYSYGTAALSVANGLTNWGTIRLESTGSSYTDSLTVESNGTLINGTTGVIEVNNGSGGNRSLAAHLINRGALVVTNDAGLSIIGDFTLDGGTVATASWITHTGGRFDLLSGSVSGAVYLVGNQINVASTAVTPCTLYVVGADNRLVGADSTAVTLWIQGNYSYGAAALTVANGLTNRGTIRLESTGSSYTDWLTVESNGTLINGETGVIEVNYGSGGYRYLYGNFANRGFMQFANGYLAANGSSFVNEATGVIAGSGTLDCAGTAFQNQGTVSPAVSGGLSFVGTFMQVGMGRLQIGIGSNSFSHLAINGNALLTGLLGVSLQDGYVPNPGSTFRVLTCSSRTGEFAALDGAVFSTNLALQPTYSAGAVDLQTATVTNPPASAPEIVVQPRDQKAALGSSTTIAVTVRGTSPFFYQWQREGTDLPGATYAALNLSDVQADQAGGYRVIITNSIGAVTSSIAVLTVIQPGLVQWDGGGDGTSWNDPYNWSNDTVPNVTNDVLIDMPGNITVTINSDVTIRSLQCEESLNVSAGSLTLTAGASHLNGTLTIAAGRVLTVSGPTASAIFNGHTTADGASLYATGGATLSLPKLHNYYKSGDSPYVSATWQASGPGSVLVLSALTNILSLWAYNLSVNALAGGQVILTNLASLDGSVVLLADGANSLVDLAQLNRVTASNGSPSFTVQNGASVLMPRLLDGGQLALSIRSGSTATTDQFTQLYSLTLQNQTLAMVNLTNLTARGSLSVEGGALVVPALAVLDSASLSVSGGAVLSLPSLQNYYKSGASPYVSATWQASGPGSVLVLPALTNILSLWAYNLSINALAGGQVVLTNLTSLDGAVAVLADGTSSVVDLTRLSTVTATNGSASFTMQNGGMVPLPVLASAWATFTVASGSALALPWLAVIQNGGITLNSGGTLVLPSLGVFDGSTLALNNGGTLALPLVETMTNSSLMVSGGGTLALPSLRSFYKLGGGYYPTWQASGAGSVLALPALTNLMSVWYYNLSINALAGGQVVLTNLTSLDGAVTVLADGASSMVDLSGLQSTTEGSSLYFTAQSGGLVDLHTLPSFFGGPVQVLADGGGSVIDLRGLSSFITRSGQSSLTARNDGILRLYPDAFLLANVAVSISAGSSSVLPSSVTANNALMLYGTPWHSYWVERFNTCGSTNGWQFFARVPLTNAFQVFAPLPKPCETFRLWEFVADPPILDASRIGADQVQLVIYGHTNANFQVETAPSLDITPADWAPWSSTGPMTNTFRIFPSFPAAEEKRFFRTEQL